MKLLFFYKYTASYGVICVTLIKIDKVASFHDPLKTLKLKTLASDCVMKKDVTTMPLSIYYD